jgi:hypothetical protein
LLERRALEVGVDLLALVEDSQSIENVEKYTAVTASATLDG